MSICCPEKGRNEGHRVTVMSSGKLQSRLHVSCTLLLLFWGGISIPGKSKHGVLIQLYIFNIIVLS